MAAAYAGPVVALDQDGKQLAVEHLPTFVLASDYDKARWTLQELRARLHAAGRRPEECYEMSLIDDALSATASATGGPK
jgi:hypothetical protein